MNELVFYDLKEAPGLTHSLASQVAREVGRRIVSGAYKAGELIEDESALADKYQVSRSVLRDAIKIIVGKGLLEARRGIGTRVRSREHWTLLDDDILAWHLSAAPNPLFLQELVDFRGLIEPRAARWAAERGSDDGRREVMLAFMRMERQKGTVEEFVFADALFHRAIIRAAQNELVRALEGPIFSALLMSIRITNADPRFNEASLRLHRKVADAIEVRDGSEAEAAMEELLVDANARLFEGTHAGPN
ncbi:MAG: FadR/GntR family transcriptional regulator [Pseudomonadota bacterium]